MGAVFQGYVGSGIGGGPGANALADLNDVVSAANTDKFVLVANGTTGYVGRALVQADISDIATISQAEAEAGVATTDRLFTAQRVAQAIAALAGVSDPLLLSDGTVSAPTYSFTNDPDAGLYLRQVGELALTLGTSATEWKIQGAAFFAGTGGGARLNNSVGSGILPNLIPNSLDPNTGIGNAAAGDALALISGGKQMLQCLETGVAATDQVIISPGVVSGSAAKPVLAFTSTSTGFWEPSTGIIKVSSAGVDRFEFNGDVFQSENSSGPAMRNVAINMNTPQFCPNQFDLDTGLGSPGQDEVSLIAGAVEAVRYVEGSGVRMLASYQLDTTLTALAGGGQGGTLLGSSYNVVTTVVTAGDSVRLMSGHPLGTKVFVKNNGANAMDIFPASGDRIDALAINIAVSLPAGKSMLFMTTTANDTWTVMDFTTIPDPLLLSDGLETAPTYSFASDPDSGLFSVSANALGLAVGGSVRFLVSTPFLAGASTTAGGIVDEAVTVTNPTVIISRSDLDTGLGGTTDLLSLIAGGVQIAQAKEVVGSNQFIIAPGVVQSNATAPSLAFGDGNTGFFEASDNNLKVSLEGTTLWQFIPGASAFFGGEITGSPGFRNLLPTTTVPNILPRNNTFDTGIGSGGVDELSLIAGGVEGLRVAESAAVITITIEGDLVTTGGGGSGPAVLNVGATATVPTLVPNQADPDTGLGRDAVDGLAFIAGGVSCMRIREIAAAPAVGFYTTTPVIKQTGVAVTSAGIHAALVNLGLIAA